MLVVSGENGTGFLNTEFAECTEKRRLERAQGGVEGDCAEGPDFVGCGLIAHSGH